MKPALLIVDVQTAICSGRWAAFDIERVVERIDGLAERARAAAVPAILIQHEEAEGPMQHGSPGWQLFERLTVQPDDIRLRKTAPDSFLRTGLHTLLQTLGVDRLVVCGLQSEFCIDSTVRGALAHGYPVTLVADAHSTLDNGVLTAAQISAHHNATLANMDSFGPRVTLRAAAEIRFDA